MRYRTKVYLDTTLISEPFVALNHVEKARGLMFSPPKDVLFVFHKEQKMHFHMIFVFYPIDIIFLDDDLRIVDLKKRFFPFTCYYSKAKSSHVLETRKGFIDEHGLRIGMTLQVGSILTLDGQESNVQLLHTYVPKKTSSPPARATRKKAAPPLAKNTARAKNASRARRKPSVTRTGTAPKRETGSDTSRKNVASTKKTSPHASSKRIATKRTPTASRKTKPPATKPAKQSSTRTKSTPPTRNKNTRGR